MHTYNDLSILLIIKLYLFINFAVCEVGYYETAAAGENTAPTCQACKNQLVQE